MFYILKQKEQNMCQAHIMVQSIFVKIILKYVVTVKVNYLGKTQS